MKYRTSIIIKQPRKRLLEILEDPEGMKFWQPGLVSYEFLSDDPKVPGARMRLNYDMKGREVEMTETLEQRSLPDTMTFIYEAAGVWNRVINTFTEIDESTSQWVQDNEFKCRGFMALMCLVMPGVFKKETGKSLELFRDYAEGL